MMEKKIFNKGEAFRVCNIYGDVFVVNIANSRYSTFRATIRDARAISGQPQLTFATEEEADYFLNNCVYLYGIDSRNYHVYPTRGVYECIKIPLTLPNGRVIDAWLSSLQFPRNDNIEAWKRLRDLYPNYFSLPNNGRSNLGFFNEDFTPNYSSFPFVNDEKVRDVMGSDKPDEVKTKLLWNRPLEHVTKCCEFVSMDSIVLNTDDYDKMTLLSWEDRMDVRDVFMHHASGVMCILRRTLSKVLSLSESYEIYVNQRNRCTPLEWWRDIANDITVIEAKHILDRPSHKLGFFNEALTEALTFNKTFTSDEIEKIVNDNTLSEDEKCMKLWGVDLDTMLQSSKLTYALGENRKLDDLIPEQELLPEIKEHSSALRTNYGYYLKHRPSDCYSVFYSLDNPTYYRNLLQSYNVYGHDDYYDWWYGMLIVLEQWIALNKLRRKNNRLGFFKD